MEKIKVLGFQLQVNLDCDAFHEYLILNEALRLQTDEAKKVIQEKDADIVVFPEMCYQDALDQYYQELSQKCLVVAGSIYEEGINKTIVYQKGKKYTIQKCNASGAEPMIRFQENMDTDTFLKKELERHTFLVKGQKVVILNCMEYYQHAYTISRTVKDLFGIIGICSNSNQKVFMEESMAIHNHVDNIYSFVVNCLSTYMEKEYAKGESYIFGPIQYHEQDWLKKEGKTVVDHPSSILKLDRNPAYFYGEFQNYFSRFGRSDDYVHNPSHLVVGNLRKEDTMLKNIIITSGPTNERLDAVMKITNMSTGALGSTIADDFLDQEYDSIGHIYYLSPKLARKPKVNDKLELILIESADDLLRALRDLLVSQNIHAVIHSSAVGDYKGDYAITAQLLAEELARKIYPARLSKEELEKLILETIRHPENIVSDEHKISSYEPDLMFKLSLTPKVIHEIKKISPQTRLFGFKLLDGVTHEELISVASRLREKNQADYIIANDLSTIGNGKHPAYFVGENGEEYTCETKKEIAKTLRKVIFHS